MSNFEQHKIGVSELSREIENKGLFVHKKGEGQLEFSFVYLGFPFSVSAKAGTKESTVEISSILGHLPYSSESRRARQGALKVLAAASHVLGQRVRLGAGQRLEMNDRRTTKDPLTPVNLLTLMTRVLLEAKPFLDLLSEILKPASENESSPNATTVNNDVSA